MYFRIFIPGLSHIGEPLQQLLGCDVVLIWSSAQDSSLKSVNKYLTSVPIIGHFVKGAETETRSDASAHGIGAVLS